MNLCGLLTAPSVSLKNLGMNHNKTVNERLIDSGREDAARGKCHHPAYISPQPDCVAMARPRVKTPLNGSQNFVFSGLCKFLNLIKWNRLSLGRNGLFFGTHFGPREGPGDGLRSSDPIQSQKFCHFKLRSFFESY